MLSRSILAIIKVGNERTSHRPALDPGGSSWTSPSRQPRTYQPNLARFDKMMGRIRIGGYGNSGGRGQTRVVQTYALEWCRAVLVFKRAGCFFAATHGRRTASYTAIGAWRSRVGAAAAGRCGGRCCTWARSTTAGRRRGERPSRSWTNARSRTINFHSFPPIVRLDRMKSLPCHWCSPTRPFGVRVRSEIVGWDA